MKIGKLQRDKKMPKFSGADKYGFNEFEIGDSRLYTPETENEFLTLYHCVCAYARRWGKTHDKEFRARKCPNEKGIRVWRLE